MTETKLQGRYLFLFPIAAMVFLLLQSPACRAGVQQGLILCGTVLIPALFPFSVLSALAAKTGFPAFAQRRFGAVTEKFFSLPGCAAVPFAIGLLGGYPLGVHCLCSMYQNGGLSKKQACHLSAFCNNPGPAFLIGAVGSVIMNSALLGLALLGIVFLSAILTGVLLAPGAAEPTQASPVVLRSEALIAAFSSAVQESTSAMLRVSGMVLFFSSFQGIAFSGIQSLRLPDWLNCLTSGSLELTAGITTVRLLAMRTRFLVCSFLVSWGGICVHFQAAEALLAANLPIGTYLAGKLVQSLLSSLLAGLLSLVLFPCESRYRSGMLVLSFVFLFFLIFFSFFQKWHWKKQRDVL